MADVVLSVATIVASIGLAILIGLFREQAKASSPLFAHWLRRQALRLLPEPLRERCDEEWASALEDTPGPIAKMWCAIGFLWSAKRIASEEDLIERLRIRLWLVRVEATAKRMRNEIMHEQSHFFPETERAILELLDKMLLVGRKTHLCQGDVDQLSAGLSNVKRISKLEEEKYPQLNRD